MAPATPAQSAILFLDLQEQIVAGAKTIGRHKLRRAAGVLARLADLHDIPCFLSAVPPGGAYLKSIVEALDEPEIHTRTFTSAFADDRFVAALESSGRRRLVLAGVASEIVVLRTALDAREAGYDVQIAVDVCGGFSERTEAAAWQRATAAGAVLTSVVTLGAELAGDFSAAPGAKTLALIHEAAGR